MGDLGGRYDGGGKQLADDDCGGRQPQNERFQHASDRQPVHGGGGGERADETAAAAAAVHDIGQEGRAKVRGRNRCDQAEMNVEWQRLIHLIPGSGDVLTGAIRLDLSKADKSIRRPDSAPDLVVEQSKRLIKSGLKQQRSLDRGEGKRKSRSRAAKRVVFTGVSDGESASESRQDEDNDEDDDDDSSRIVREMIRRRKQHRTYPPAPKPPPKPAPILPGDDIWVLRQDSGSGGAVSGKQAVKASALSKEDNVPVTGIVIAQPQTHRPCIQTQQPIQVRVISVL
jgi:hypothetical protein